MNLSSERISFNTVSFSKNQSILMIQRISQAFQKELGISLNLIQDQRWTTFIKYLQKQSNGSLVKLWQLIETKEWFNQLFIEFKDHVEIKKQQNETQNYYSQLKQYQQEIQRRKQLFKREQNTTKESKLKQQQQLKKSQKQKQKQKQEMDNINQVDRKKSEQFEAKKDQNKIKNNKIKIIQSQIVSQISTLSVQPKKQTKEKNVLSKYKQGDTKAIQINESISDNNKKSLVSEKTNKQQSPFAKSFKVNHKIDNKTIEVILDQQDLEQVQNNQSATIRKCQQNQSIVNLNTLQRQSSVQNKEDQKLECSKLQQQQLPVIKPPSQPIRRNKQIEECLSKIMNRFKQLIQSNFSMTHQMKQSIANSEFQEVLEFIKSHYQQKRIKYSEIDIQLSTLLE